LKQHKATQFILSSYMLRMALRTLSAANAAALDKDLMSTGAFSLDQLMELAGLSVSQAVYRVHPPPSGKDVLIVCGPGNNGGDGLVAARHLYYYGYKPTICYPKPGRNELYQRLTTQLKNLDIPFTDDFHGALGKTNHVVDAIFGFSFEGEVREPFDAIIEAMEKTKVPVTSVDAPSSWRIETGPPESGPGQGFMPETLVSLTAPKPLVKHFRGRHFVGGRFLPPEVAKKYNLDMPKYEGVDQIVEVEGDGSRL
jgi:NAD(P)H-hydrate epimerase